MTQGQFFKWSLTGLNSEFSFSKTSCLTKAEEPSLSYYLPIAGGRIIEFIPLPRVLVLCEMQQVSSISHDDKHYTTGTSTLITVLQFVIDNSLNTLQYSQNDFHWIMPTSQLLNRSVSSTDPLTTAFNIMTKDSLLFSKNPV